MKLYIMRHGPAEDQTATSRDSDRALTREGAARVRSVAISLAERGEAPREILSSPVVRARETAEIVAARVFSEPSEHPITFRSELGLTSARLRALVGELLQQGKRRIMLVGHEPSLSDFVEMQLGVRLPLGMQKAMVVSARVNAIEGSEAWEVTPRFILEPKTLSYSVL